MSPTVTTDGTYNYKVVRQFAVMTVIWGIVGMLVGVIIAAQMAWPELNFGVAMAVVRASAPAAHERGDLRVRRLRAVRDQLLRRAAHFAGAAVLRRPGRIHVLGLATHHRARGGHAAARHDQRQGVRGARVADRHPDRARVGRLRGRVLRDHLQAQGEPHLRRQLVLRRLHPDRGAAAHRQQPGGAGGAVQVVLGLSRAHRTRWCSGGTATTRSASS